MASHEHTIRLAMSALSLKDAELWMREGGTGVRGDRNHSGPCGWHATARKRSRRPSGASRTGDDTHVHPLVKELPGAAIAMPPGHS